MQNESQKQTARVITIDAKDFFLACPICTREFRLFDIYRDCFCPECAHEFKISDMFFYKGTGKFRHKVFLADSPMQDENLIDLL